MLSMSLPSTLMPSTRLRIAALALALLATGCTPQKSDGADAAPTVADPADWCAGHALPESMCTKCNPELTAKFKASGDWCAEHELPESVCPECNPMRPPAGQAAHAAAAQKQGDAADWCAGHALPESMCTKCNPELTAKFKASGDWCAGHGFPESACPECHPMKPPADYAAHAAAAQRQGDAADWCAGHALPESMCTKCNPELTAKFKASGDWCAGHGFPESACPKCHPMKPPQADAPGAKAPEAKAPGAKARRKGDPADWCAEHALPESMCARCEPGVAKQYKASGDWCDEHFQPESVCPYCNPMEPPAGARRGSAIAPGTQIRFKSAAVARTAGLEWVPAATAEMGVHVEAPARIEFDRNRMAEVRSPVPGIVRDIAVDVGAQVKADDVLFTLESAHVGELQARRRAARGQVETASANLARQEGLGASGIASEREIEVARQELQSAQAGRRAIDQSLRISGAARGGSTGRFEVAAPTAGSVVRRPALLGTFAAEADALATIADTTVMWALLDLPEWEAASVRVGQSVELTVGGVAGRSFDGNITWLAAEVDPRTRAVTARAEVKNEGGLLRAGQFARGRIGVESPEGSVVVPLGAVQRVDLEAVVFVRIDELVYEPRVVVLGRSDGRQVQIAGAVGVGDEVVTTGAYLLRTELSRDSIGAGCCAVEAPGGS